MNKAYFIVPIVGVAAFAGVYLSFRKDLEEAKHREVEEKEKARIAKQQADIKKQQEANRYAVEQQELRKKQKAEREAMLAAEIAAKDALVEARSKAYDDQQKFAQTVERLDKDLSAEKEALKKLEEDRDLQTREQNHLKELVKQLEANRKGAEDAINKIDAASRLWEEKAKAEAAAKAKS